MNGPTRIQLKCHVEYIDSIRTKLSQLRTHELKMVQQGWNQTYRGKHPFEHLDDAITHLDAACKCILDSVKLPSPETEQAP
jgi:hypothetical protein